MRRLLSAVSTRMPTVTMPPPLMSAARCSARRALRLRRTVTASSFRWLSSFGKLKLVAVESTGCYAAGLVRYLRSPAVRVLEVNEPHPHTRRRLG